MYYLNKIVGGILNPLVIPIILVCIAAVLAHAQRRRGTLGVLAGAFVWMWVWGTAVWYHFIGMPLERRYPIVPVENLPKADAIVLLGGGMQACPAASIYADMNDAADRVWHAARLYKAGKAPLVIPTGVTELESTMPLLRDFGVPPAAIRVENQARNTEENARYVAALLKRPEGPRPRVLLVTSAWHMRRAALMYARYAPDLDIVPAATDYQVTVSTEGRPFRVSDFFPSADVLQKNGVLMREWVGYFGYRFLRR